jgi:hypothetical protein
MAMGKAKYMGLIDDKNDEVLPYDPELRKMLIAGRM